MTQELNSMRSALLEAAKHSPREHSWHRKTGSLVLVHCAVVAIALAISASMFGLFPAMRGLGAPLTGFAVVAALFAAFTPGPATAWLTRFASGLALVAVSIHLLEFAPFSGAYFFADADCAVVEFTVAIVPGIATILLLRNFAYQRSRATMGGLAAALTGWFVLDLTCPVAGIQHVLAFHLAPAGLVVLLTVLVRMRTTSFAHIP